MARRFSSTPPSVLRYIFFLCVVFITAFISLLIYFSSEQKLLVQRQNHTTIKELQGKLPDKSLLLQKLQEAVAENNNTVKSAGAILWGTIQDSVHAAKKSDISDKKAFDRTRMEQAEGDDKNPAKNGTLNYNVHLFYYPWYGHPDTDGKYIHWNHQILPYWKKEEARRWPQGIHKPPDDIASNFYPALGPYSSADHLVVDKHMQQIKSSGAGVIVVSWYPPGQADDNGKSLDWLFPLLLDSAHKHGVKVAVHIEPYKNRSGETLQKNIHYIIDTYGKHPGLYRREAEGKQLPVYYIYDSYQIDSSDWAKALKSDGKHSLRGTQYDGIFLGLYLGPEDEHKLTTAGFDGFYTYFAANGFTKGSSWSNWKTIAQFAAKNNLLFVPSVGPGYVDTRIRPWNRVNTRKRLQGKYFRQSFEAALDAGVKVISVTSFNEWHEGSQVEPAVPKEIEGFKYEDYSPGKPDYYLKLLKDYVDKFSQLNGSS